MLTGEAEAAIRNLGEQLLSRQAEDGSWRLCFESGPMTDAFMIVTLKILGMDGDEIVGKLAYAIAKRRGDDGQWRVYPDETEGNLSATIQAVIGLAAAGVNVGERKYEETFRWLKLRDGIAEADTLTKVMAAVVNKYRWRNPFFIRKRQIAPTC